jgi:hypothetical protein
MDSFSQLCDRIPLSAHWKNKNFFYYLFSIPHPHWEWEHVNHLKKLPNLKGKASTIGQKKNFQTLDHSSMLSEIPVSVQRKTTEKYISKRWGIIVINLDLQKKTRPLFHQLVTTLRDDTHEPDL